MTEVSFMSRLKKYTAKVTATEKVEKVNASTLIFTIAPATGNS